MGLVLLLLGVSPAAAQDQTLTGWFTFIVADYPSDTGLTSETTYFLTEDSGERHELLIAVELMQPLGGPVALNRKRVTVEGEWEEVGPDATEKFRVYSIELAAVPSTTLRRRSFASDVSPDEPAPLASTSRAAVKDSRAWVTILCRFGDATDVTPHPVSHYERMMGASYPSLEHYWQEVSYGNIPDLRGSVVVGWYNLPQPRSYYIYDTDGDGEEDSDFERLAEDCAAAADADVFFPDFEHINLVFNQNLDGRRAYGGTERLRKDGEARFWGGTWLPEWAHEKQEIWAHEMGHALGLKHSSGPYDETYDSEWDVMSDGESLDPHPGYGHLGVHTIAYHKDFLGWIPPDRKYVAAPNTTQTITLERLAQPEAEGYLMAQIPIGRSQTDFYTVETRLFAGYDDGIPDEAIVIHKVDTTLADRLAQVVDVDNNGDPNDEGAMWTVGETFTDPSAGLQVSVDAERATGFQVTIDYICSEALSSTRRVLRGRAGTASVAVEAPSGCRWEASSDSLWLTILTGSGSGNGSVVYAVAANPSLNARTGTLIIGGRTFTVIQAGVNDNQAGVVNDNLLEEDMESGMDGWREYGCNDSHCSHRPLSLTTASRSGTFAWTDSPGGNYQNSAFLRSPTIDLTAVTFATLTFWQRYDFASGDHGSVNIYRQNEHGSWSLVGSWRRREDGSLTWEGLRTFTGTNMSWEQVSIDLTPFVGERIELEFYLVSYATETADGWYIDDVAVSSLAFVAPEETQAVLENPSSASSQSGVGVISGWACHAHEIVIELDGRPLQAAYGTVREDTRGVCGDANNGFSLLWNWNNLGAGLHTVHALLDGVEFANTTVQVTTFGEDPFPRGWSGTFDLPDFPISGETTLVQWEESLQNFVITDGQPNTGGGHNRVAGVSALLENPSLGAAQSGVGVISGWACEAEEIVIELDGVPLKAGYGTTREDTRGVCGDANNGFSLLWNWNNLGAGPHTVRALLDGVEFANTTVRVTTFGEGPFPRGLNGTFPLSDFPHPGDTTTLRWEESLQNFVIIP